MLYDQANASNRRAAADKKATDGWGTRAGDHAGYIWEAEPGDLAASHAVAEGKVGSMFRQITSLNRFVRRGSCLQEAGRATDINSFSNIEEEGV